MNSHSSSSSELKILNFQRVKSMTGEQNGETMRSSKLGQTVMKDA